MMRKLWGFFSWQVEEVESWLMDMAAKGWHLSHTGTLFAVFTKGEPEHVRYRCDCFKHRNPELYERVNIYKAAGWDYVCSRGDVHIFRAPAVSSVPEIHSDPQESQSNDALRKLLTGSIALLAAWKVVIIMYLLRSGSSHLLSLLLADSILSWVMIPFSIYGLFFSLWHIGRSLLVLARARKGQLYSHKPYRAAQWVNQAGGVLLVAFFISLFAEFAFVTPVFKHSLPEGGIPSVRIAQLLPEADVVTLWTSYSTDSSLLVPEQWGFNESARVKGVHWPGGSKYEPTLQVDGYKARTDWLARQLAKTLAREAADLLPSKLSTGMLLNRAQVKDSPFAALWYFYVPMNQEIIALQGEYVIHVKYDGMEQIEGLYHYVRTELDKMEGKND